MMAALVLQFFFACRSMVACVAFALSLFIHLSFFVPRGLFFVIVAFPEYFVLRLSRCFALPHLIWHIC